MKVFYTPPKILFFCLAWAIALASCSNTMNDSVASSSNDGLRICLVSNSDITSRSANAPYTAEVLIKQESKTIAQDSKELAKNTGASFEFKNLPYDVELNIDVNIYIGSTKIFYGSTTHTIIPNQDNLVSIMLNTIQNEIPTTTFEGGDLSKVDELLKLVTEKEQLSITIAFTSKPNMQELMQTLAKYSIDSVNIDFSSAGAISFTSVDLTAIENNANKVGGIEIASNSSLTINANNHSAIQKFYCEDKVNIIIEENFTTSSSYNNVLSSIKGSENSLFNVHLDLSKLRVNSNGTPVKMICESDNNYRPANVKSINLTGIARIESNAFTGWTGLSNVVIPSSVTYLGKGCIDGNKIASIAGGNWKGTDTSQTPPAPDSTPSRDTSHIKSNISTWSYER